MPFGVTCLIAFRKKGTSAWGLALLTSHTTWLQPLPPKDSDLLDREEAISLPILRHFFLKNEARDGAILLH